MATGTLPLEILTRVVQHLRPSELPPLCQTCRALQRVVERKLYGSLVLGSANVAYRACMSLQANGGVRGPYVKKFWFWIDSRRTVDRNPLPSQFWHAMRSALSTMTELKDLMINDPAETNTWILDPEMLKCQLRTAKFRLVWDEKMVAFLATQSELKHLQTLDAPDLSQVPSLLNDQLPSLEAFEGPLMTAVEVVACPRLTHLRTFVDQEVQNLLPQFVHHYVTHRTPLRSLHINGMPDTVVGDTLDALTADPKWCVQIRYLGVVPMPFKDRYDIHRHLMKLHNLKCIAFDVSHLDPPPIDVLLRSFAMEMHMYCLSLQRVLFGWGRHQVKMWVLYQDVWTLSSYAPSSLEDQIWLYG